MTEIRKNVKNIFSKVGFYSKNYCKPIIQWTSPTAHIPICIFLSPQLNARETVCHVILLLLSKSYSNLIAVRFCEYHDTLDTSSTRRKRHTSLFCGPLGSHTLDSLSLPWFAWLRSGLSSFEQAPLGYDFVLCTRYRFSLRQL